MSLLVCSFIRWFKDSLFCMFTSNLRCLEMILQSWNDNLCRSLCNIDVKVLDLEKMSHFKEVPVHWVLSLREDTAMQTQATLSKIWINMVWYQKWALLFTDCVTWRSCKNFLKEFIIISSHNNDISFSRGSTQVAREYNRETWFGALE